MAAMLRCARPSSGLRHLRNVSYALDGYFGQAPHPSDANYQTETQRRLEARLQARYENKIVQEKLGRLEIVPELRTEFTPTNMDRMDPRPLTKMIPIRKVRTGLIGKKLGMMRLYDEHGIAYGVTVLQVDNCEVLLPKTRYGKGKHERGLCGLVLGYGSKKIRQIPRAQLGEYNKYRVCPKRRLVEFPVSREALLPSGTQLDVRHFLPGQKVDVIANTKYKRWCGVVKRWGFAGGPATHGSTKFHRRPGSIGACADPGKVWKGKKMAGPMGGQLRTHRHQYVMRIDPRHGLIFIRGAVPGNRNCYVKIIDSTYRAPVRSPFPTFFPDPEETDPGPPRWMRQPLRMETFKSAITMFDADEKEWVNRYTKDLN